MKKFLLFLSSILLITGCQNQNSASVDNFGGFSGVELWKLQTNALSPLKPTWGLVVSNASTTNSLSVGGELWVTGQPHGISLDEIENLAANKTFNNAANSISFNFTNPTNQPTYDGAFEIQASGAFSGHLLHVHQHTGNPTYTHLTHLESEDVDVVPLWVSGTGTTSAHFQGGVVEIDDNLIANGKIGVNNTNPSGAIDIAGTDAASSSLYFTRYSANANPPLIYLQKSRSSTVGTQTIVQNADAVGTIYFAGSDGTNQEILASINGEVDGVPGNNDMPGKITFYTTPNDSNVLALRMMIRQNGFIGINQSNPTGALFSIATSTNWVMGGSAIQASAFYLTQTSDVGGVATKVPTAFISASSTYPALRVLQPNNSSNAGPALHVSAQNATTTLYVVGNSRFEGNTLTTGNATTTSNQTVMGNLAVGTIQPDIFRAINANNFTTNQTVPLYGIYSSSTNTAIAQPSYGLFSLAKNTNQTTGYAYGIYAKGTMEGNLANNLAYGAFGEAVGTGFGTTYGIYGKATGAPVNYAGYFEGNVYTSGSSTTTDLFTHTGKTAIFASSTAATTTAGTFFFGKTGTATTTVGIGSVTQKGCLELSDKTGVIYRVIVDAGVLNVKLGRCN